MNDECVCVCMPVHPGVCVWKWVCACMNMCELHFIRVIRGSHVPSLALLCIWGSLWTSDPPSSTPWVLGYAYTSLIEFCWWSPGLLACPASILSSETHSLHFQLPCFDAKSPSLEFGDNARPWLLECLLLLTYVFYTTDCFLQMTS